jgi:hypothetical protein
MQKRDDLNASIETNQTKKKKPISNLLLEETKDLESMPISVNNRNNVHPSFGRGIEPILENSNADYATNFKAEAMEQIMPS